MAKILVTGASGFIGSRVVRQLCERGDAVKVLLRPSASRRALKGLPVEIAEGDIMIASTVYRALMGCDRLFHVAANYKMWDSDPKKVLEPSIRGTREVLEAVRRHDGMIRKVVVTSSVAAIGATSTAGGEVLDETSPWKLDESEQYVVAKRRAEEVALAAAKDLPIVVVNPAGVFGPGDARPTPSGQLIVRYLNWSAPIPFPGSPGGISVVDVDDVARGHLLAMEKGRIGERYILGGENLSITQILRNMSEMTGLRGPGREPPKGMAVALGWLMESWARVAGGEPEVTHKMARDFFDGAFWVKSDKAKNELGYSFRPARKTLARAMRWYLDNGYVDPSIARVIRYDELPGRDPDPSLPHERSAVFAEG
jgi:dihydroflavonol-4-reductase